MKGVNKLPELLSIKDAAIRLDISHDTIRRMINNDKIQTVIVGKREIVNRVV